MYFVMQNFPEERVVLATISEDVADDFFNLQVQQGKGWYELWREGGNIPLQEGGEKFYAPYQPNKWDDIRNNSVEEDFMEVGQPIYGDDKHRLILTTWE